MKNSINFKKKIKIGNTYKKNQKSNLLLNIYDYN